MSSAQDDAVLIELIRTLDCMLVSDHYHPPLLHIHIYYVRAHPDTYRCTSTIPDNSSPLLQLYMKCGGVWSTRMFRLVLRDIMSNILEACWVSERNIFVQFMRLDFPRALSFRPSLRSSAGIWEETERTHKRNLGVVSSRPVRVRKIK